MMNNRTPSQGLKVLEELHQNNPYHQGIINNLINAYIRFGMHDKAMKMIANIPDSKTDVQSLKFRAWHAYQSGDVTTEYSCWESIFHRQLAYIPLEDRFYLITQAKTTRDKINLFKESWGLLFNFAYSSLPVNIQVKLGDVIKEVVLIANNNALTLSHHKEHIKPNSLIVCFNHNVFLPYHEEFPDNIILLFFRKENHLNHNFLGLPESPLVYDTDRLFALMKKENVHFLFNEHKPHTLKLPDEVYSKINSSNYSSTISQFHRIFQYLTPMDFYFNQSCLTPTSGFMVFRYLYYARLYLLGIGKPTFDIKLLGFNFRKDSYYPTHGTHNWDYERSQLENLPSGVTRVIV